MPTDPSSGLRPRPPGGQACASLAKAGRGYPHYCEPEFRAWTESGNAAEHTAAEVSYLCRVLPIQGRRVVDLGCGAGDRAIALAKAGFGVIGVDVCETAIEEARRRAARYGITIEWLVLDPSDGDKWPFNAVDAIVWMQVLGSGPDFFPLRILRKIRRHLAENGMLILEQSPYRLNQNYSAEAYEKREFSCTFESQYRPTTEPTRSGGGTSSSYDFRQFSPAELVSLVRAAGFVIEKVDSDLSQGNVATAESARTEVVARRLPSPPASLAVAEWGRQSTSQLDLRYASDEAELLDPTSAEVWQQVIRSTAHLGSELVGNYPVYDPFGAERGMEVVAEHFGCVLSPSQVTFGAGVTGFLQYLSDLADGGPIAAPGLVHGDLEAWAVNRGIEVRLVPDDVASLRAALETREFAMLHLDRPTFTGQFLALDELEGLIGFASRSGTFVLIDESAAPYPGPAHSAVPLVNRVNNLVVLRGFTKAYSWGGLRAGFAVASSELAPRIRELVPPLQIGELALHAVLRLLRAGDVFSRLRAHIHMVKPRVTRLLSSCGFKVIEGHPSFPWVAIANEEGGAERHFAQCGIRCLRPAPSPIMAGPPQVVRITIPLSNERITLFNDLLSGMQETTGAYGATSGQHPVTPSVIREVPHE
jgi:histidinol-phosphate/aromatic aminotransferase/cobyric acid decarboxylase-like protein/protein-L-isoaspartate O-methyltransferase